MNTIELPFDIRELADDQNMQPVVIACIDEQPVRLVIDTGASHSCLSKKTIKQLTDRKEFKADIVMGVGSGRLNNELIEIPCFKLGDLIIRDHLFLSLQISHVNKVLKSLGIEPIDGLLGSDILCEYNAIIDYSARKIIFRVDLDLDNNE
ncbi:MAG: retroviral-like aspartic protease family protein [Bacteroidales bacterium]|jgi:hypothetical protein|nr:retroviral-like aspartic protease family protein [Bacteroidales bacterium]